MRNLLKCINSFYPVRLIMNLKLMQCLDVEIYRVKNNHFWWKGSARIAYNFSRDDSKNTDWFYRIRKFRKLKKRLVFLEGFLMCRLMGNRSLVWLTESLTAFCRDDESTLNLLNTTASSIDDYLVKQINPVSSCLNWFFGFLMAASVFNALLTRWLTPTQKLILSKVNFMVYIWVLITRYCMGNPFVFEVIVCCDWQMETPLHWCPPGNILYVLISSISKLHITPPRI